MMLEVVYEALESAGYTLHQHAGEKVAVFAGLMTGDYDTLSQRDELDTSQYYATGNARSILSNRISYFFNFQGPSMTIDTACSSSLVALHQAVLSLRSGECKMACVAGANLILTPEQFIVESNLHMLSPTGHCRMWDAGANGYARGEGVAAIFIKPLSQALADGDRIEAIIRETGVNSDGRSRGITMPNWEAQSRLIQDTYQRAGLDPNIPEDRCQYFEAHGTGTSAGDPNEARAIEDAFFGRDNHSQSDACDCELLVGSIKTVVGHTEGAAGLAGLLKVVESMRNDLVPPNLHLEKLNPEVERYYTNLRVPTSAIPWPEVPAGQPKRGSVNSFGFGGTNAHAIVEQYKPEVHDQLAKFSRPTLGLPTPARLSGHPPNAENRVCLPLVLSAPSQKSLADVVKAYRDYLLQDIMLSSAPEEVAWHNFARRTAFPFRVSFSSLSVSGLVEKLHSLVIKTENSPTASIGTRARHRKDQPKILGVFTGQGAQWATMSRGLLRSSNVYARTIQSLDDILRTCPDPPTWSLEQEILADEDLSRVQKASVSQPLCTAIQLALIELLRHLGIAFHAVVGHSSGEIAAAYAAGRISIRDAILISHYRGLGVHMARGANGAEGGMLAAGLSREEATKMCATKKYSNRLWVAASNSPSSVTLSGDRDAVQEAHEDLKQQQKFARVLLIDKAYHSPHMAGASVKYLKTLAACGLSPTKGNGITWVSSVCAGEPSTTELAASYWKDNMVQTVMFSEAVSTALETLGPFDCAIEVGPHAALKGPVTQVMKGRDVPLIPYSGLLERKLDDREAFANFLGWMWTHFGSSSSQIRQFVLDSAQPKLANTRLLNAPSYPWDHSQKFYRESRISRQYHFKTGMPHELLGVRTRDDNKHQLRWRNVLKFNSLPWVKHHSFQGQALLPASAYLVMTLDAARVALAGRQASVVELRDLKFPSGITLDPNTPGVEVLFNLTIEREVQDTIDASFTLTSVIADGRSEMRKNFSGNLTITLGEPSTSALPSRPTDRAETLHASPEAFYDMMTRTGLAYTSPFKSLLTLERRYNFASGTLKKYHDEDTTALAISPATLDSCLQTAFVTISSPGDKAIWTSFLPLDIECVRFNLATCDIKDREKDSLAVDAYMTKATPSTGQTSASFTADIEIFNPQGDMEIQVQGLTVGSFSPTKPEDDYELYLTTKLDIDPDDEILCGNTLEMQTTNLMLVKSCERVASFYASQGTISRPRSPLTAAGQIETPKIPAPWPWETEETLDKFARASPHFSTLDFIRELGENLPDVLTGMLPAVIEEAHQLAGFQKHISRVVRQIAHKYPRMSVLGLTDPELGLTEHILAGLQESFVSYRIGSEPETNLESRIHTDGTLRRKIMVDKVDLDGTQLNQGPSYDLVVLATSLIESQKTANVLNAVKSMMRPGGFLVLVGVSRSPLKGRIRRCAGLVSTETPPLSPPDWPDVLDQCGFEYSMKNGHQYYQPGFSLIVRQAESVEKTMLLQPFAGPDLLLLVDRLLVVGGKQPWTSLIANGVWSAANARCDAVEVVETLESVDPRLATSFSAAIFLNDLDEPVLATMTEQRMESLRALFRPEMMILWVTYNARFHNPDHAASFGFARTLAAETPGLVLQMLDLDTMDTVPAVEAITETFARLTKNAVVSDVHATKPLWITEPEVHLQNGHRLVPRVLPWKEGNARINAPRRVVSNTVNTLESVVRIMPSQSEDGSSKYEVDVDQLDVLARAPDRLVIQVDYSTVQAVNVGLSSSHLCIGRDSVTGKTQVAVSEANASYIAVPPTSALSIDNAALHQPTFLALLVRHLAALTISSPARAVKSVLLIKPDSMFHDCAQDIFSSSGIQLRACSTDPAKCAITPGMAYLHPGSPLREVKALYPPEGGLVIDMLPQPSKVSEMFVQALPRNCRYTTYSAFLGSCPLSNKWDNHFFPGFLQQAVSLSLSKVAAWQSGAQLPIVMIPELVGPSTMMEPFQIVDWKAERSVSQIVRPLVGTQLLNPTKTYVLVGLTRDFGQSLCTLFIEQGARYIVLCSRNPPQMQPKWQTEMLRRGITVRFEPLDVTSLERVVAFKAKLAETLPPVGGVVNGAMVLEDRVFSQMSLETLQRVMNPKTVGSKNLDLVFDSPDMDFFIMTSSFAAIGGHAGQSNYAAANMYMNGLAASRRHRGLPASVINIGVIYGLGFLHREQNNLYRDLEREGYPPISERDIHHMFVEAIAAGRPLPDGGQIYDLTTGLRRFPAANPTLAWHHDPRFSHFTRRDDDDDASAVDAGSQKKRTLKELVDAAATESELVDVLVHGFIERLQSQLQLPPGNVTGEHSIVELGVDSLAAVELRSWAWKALGQDVAVMKILGGATVLEVGLEIAGAVMGVRREKEVAGAGTGAGSGGVEARPPPPVAIVVSEATDVDESTDVGRVRGGGESSLLPPALTVASPSMSGATLLSPRSEKY
jgi:acyl transferase domain-containing protein/NAD(P)-dependent dehydrogenase (short-subunit alcohol dehydrogenase family)